jgi:hypothetical protein
MIQSLGLAALNPFRLCRLYVPDADQGVNVVALPARAAL